MTKKRQLWIIGAFCALLFAVCSTIAIFGFDTVARADATWNDIEIQSEYAYGSEFRVPSRTVTVGGATVEATSVLEKPSGQATRLTVLTLNEGGVYKLRYTAVCNGVPYADERTFFVADDFVSFGKNSSVQYGTFDSVAAGASDAVTTPGMLVRLAEGDTLTFNSVIDVRDVTKADTLVEAFATPDVMGRADFKRIIFTFTDARDPSVFLRFSGKQSLEGDEFPVTYFLSGGSGQVLAGYESELDKIHIDNEWGTWTRHSFTGKFKPDELVAQDKYRMSIRYDAKEIAAYAGDQRIIDLDDPKYFANLWYGFPSGAVRLSVKCDEYTADTANFCISSVRGLDLTSKVATVDAPVITVDNTEYKDGMPTAKVGGAYPVPSAVAYDDTCGESEVRTSVYYNYTSPNAALVPVEDGKFAVRRAGRYAIVYEAVNQKGKSSSVIVWVDAQDDVPPITIYYDDNEMNVTVGEWVAVPNATETTGGSGNITVRKQVIFDQNATDITDGFRPEKEGDYTVRYTATDYIGQTVIGEYTVSARLGDMPIFVDKPILPHYFISGANYTVPMLYANDYSSEGMTRRPAKVEIIDKAGTHTLNAGETFTPEVAVNGEEVIVTFVCGEARLPIKVPTVLAWIEEGGRPRLHMENYFVGDGFSIEKNDLSMTVSATQSSGGWTFANALLAQNMELLFDGIADSCAFDALRIVLTDAEQSDVSVAFRIKNTGNKATIEVNGRNINLSYGFTEGSRFSVGYADAALKLGASRIAIERCVSGEMFMGFPSDKVMLSVFFEGATAGKAAYNLVRINGSTMNNSATDRSGPSISVLSDSYGGSVAPGSTVLLPIAKAGDTLDPNVNFSLTVYDPQNNVMRDVNGTLLQNVNPCVEYKILCDQYGQYRVAYTASDTFKQNARPNINNVAYVITVEDEEGPVITFAKEFVTNVTVGTAVAIPDITVSDNVSAAENIKILRYVINPKGNYIDIPDGSNAIRCSMAGVYEFGIIAMDEAGNMTTVRVAVTVVKG